MPGSRRVVVVYGKVILTDVEKCTGCQLCAAACSIAHTGDVTFERAHINIHRTGDQAFVPLTCHHCETPSCALACPTKACSLDEKTNRVHIDPDVCIGCQTCVVACPFGHAHFDRVARVSVKCDYCDGEPECVRVCEPKALRYVYSEENSLDKRWGAGTVRAALRLRGVL
jgi:Fe-S-cluster-containing dehydrogenase component